MKRSKLFIAAAIALTGAVASAQNLAPVDEAAPKTEAKAAKPEAKDVKAEAKDAKAEAPAQDVEAIDPTVAQVDKRIAAEEAAEAEKAKRAIVYKQSKLIPSVIITANYEMPNLFVETARKQLQVPYIIILDDARQPKADARLAFFPPKAKEPVFLTAKDLSKLLAYLRAREVIFLGNSDYVPSFYTLAVPKGSRVIMVSDADWQVNAYKLSNTLRSDKIIKAYRAFQDKRAADLKKKREEYEQAEKAKREAIENAGAKQRALIEAESY